MKRSLSHSETREFLSETSKYNLDYTKKDKFELYGDVILVNGEPMFFYHEKRLSPTLKLLLKKNILKAVTVDMGAIKFVVAGADVMRPGITNIEQGILKDELVAVVDMTHGKPLAVGIAQFSFEEMSGMKSGKVVKNIHYIGDRVWLT